MDTIGQYERVFLYFYDNYSHLNRISKIIETFISENCTEIVTCPAVEDKYLIRYFIKCRIFHTVKLLNINISKAKESEKIKKITHQ